MVYNKVEARERFNYVEIGITKQSFKTLYTCPKCNNKTDIKSGDLDKNIFKNSSDIGFERKFDFLCKVCKTKVRLVYYPTEFRMACHYHTLKYVLE